MRLTIHLPGVTLLDAGGALGPGRVEQLPFEAWQRLDDSFPFSQRKYEEARPAFWAGNVEMDDEADQEKIIASTYETARKLHCAFLFDLRVPLLPTPSLSVMYAGVGEGFVRSIGPAEREWIIFGSPIAIPYGAEELAAVGRELAWIAPLNIDQAVNGVRAGIATLERTSRPDSWWGTSGRPQSVSGFVHCMAACESLLLGKAPADDTLTDGFGKHAAALMNRSYEDMTRAAPQWSNLYRLRSQLIHGQIGLGDLDEDVRQRLHIARVLLRSAIKAAVALDLETLRSALADAFRDPAKHAALHDTLGEDP